MKFFFVALIVGLSTTVAYGQISYLQQLNHVATITFPDTPKIKPTKNGIFYSVHDSGSLYLVQVSVIKKGLLDFFNRNLNEDVSAGVIIGSLKSSKGKLLYKKKIVLDGLEGQEFCYTALMDSVKYYRYHQSFYFNSTLLFSGYWSPDSLNGEKKAESFFNTLKLTINKAEIIQGNSRELAYNEAV